MAKSDEESKSDGLEILSVGTLYTGPWDKKYWSSSRGKDRYPYPVGYQALRTHKGLTCRMEIYEGPKGPMFQITSNNRQSGSGDTPDRAWENFQKKYCSRVKLWHGKRFSGKVDGVEFFGLKNALVQRLLREMVATVNGASEQSSLCNDFNEASANDPDTAYTMTDKCPDFMPYLDENRVTGKRNRPCRGIEMRSACKDSIGKYLAQQKDNAGKVLCSTSCKINDELMASCASGEKDISHASGALTVSLEMECVKNISLSAHAFEACDDSKAEPCSAEVQRKFPFAGTCTSASLVNLNIPQEEKPLDRQCIEVQGHRCPATTEDKDEKAQILRGSLDPKPPVLNDSQAHCGDLCAPDTMDTQQEISSCSNPGKYKQENSTEGNEPAAAAAAAMIMSEEPITASVSEEGNSYLNGNSERSDFDSVGEDITKSMMTVLLPQAVPLLIYSSRKKRRRTKPSKGSPCGKKQENELKGTIPSVDVIPPVEALADSGYERPANPHVSGVCIDAAVPLLGNIRYVVPDSLDDQLEDHVANQLLTDNAEAVTSESQKGKHEPGGEVSSFAVNANEKFCYNQINEVKEIFCEESKALHPSICCASSIMVNLVTPSKDECFAADDGFKPFGICSERTQLEDAATCEGPRCIPLSVKRHSIPYNAPQDPSLEAPGMGKHSGPLSESIICRNAGDTGLSETFHAVGNMVAPDSIQFTSMDDGDRGETSFGVEGRLGGQIPLLLTEDNHEALAPDSGCHVLNDQPLSCTIDTNATEFIGGNLDVRNSEVFVDPGTTGKQHCGSVDHSIDHAGGSSANCVSHVSECQDDIRKNAVQEQDHNDKIDTEVFVDPGTTGKQHCGSVDHSIDHTGGSSANCVSHVSECQDDIRKNAVQEQDYNDKIDRAWKLIGYYSHPVQISSVILTRNAHDIYVCVSCGLPEERKRDLFLYKIDAKEPSPGSPYLVAQTSMYLPILKDEFGREVAVDKTGLQFTPDATGLVIADSIRTPYCREKDIHCLCPQCESCCFEENAIKIVQVKLGYVSVLLKLNTIHPLHCILVCQPEHMIALDESGIIYIWVMNPTWSVQLEEYVIPSYEFLPSRIVELKKIPRSASMVVGHNGYGEFSLWDIIKRTVVSRFSAPVNSVLQFVPVSVFIWKKKSLQSDDKPVMEEFMKKLMEATMLWFSGHNEENILSQMEGKDLAMWLFISSSSDSRVQSCSSSFYQDLDGCWKLGLLIKNRMILGTAVPPSTTAIGTAAGHGIIGTDRGHVYTWDLATATKLRTLLDFAAGGGVSHIVADDSTSSAVAIARDAELFVYVHP